MNPIIGEIHQELDALIDVIKAFAEYTPRSSGARSLASSSAASQETMRCISPAVTETGPPPLWSQESEGYTNGTSIPLQTPKSGAGESLNQELLTMFSVSSISPASGRLRLPTKEQRLKTGLRLANQVRYVKVHLMATYTAHDKTYHGKVTFMTYTVDNRQMSEDRALDSPPSDAGEESDFKPKVTHTKGKVHVLCEKVESKKLETVKESLGTLASKIKGRLENKYYFNLYDWRSDTHDIDPSAAGMTECLAYEKILMYKKTLNPGSDETDSWESDSSFLSQFIN